MAQVNATNVTIEGLSGEFWDTYEKTRITQASPYVATLTDTIQADNAYRINAFFKAAPHLAFWQHGDGIPIDVMDSVQWTNYVHNWGRRIAWSKFDREDDQTDSLVQVARGAGASAAVLEERIFIDLVTAGTTDLPTAPNGPDGAAMFSTTDGNSANRFGISSGNLLTGSGVTTVQMIHADFYSAIEQFKLFQDGKGQPLLSPNLVDQGVIILHAVADTQVFEQAFLQQRHAIGFNTTGARSSAATITAAVQESNLVRDSSRNVELWGSSRLATGDWYIFLKASPTKPAFFLDRKPLIEMSSLEGENNGDALRNTGEEYIQWERRLGGGINEPYGAIKINN